jgi:hypothetical protein
MTKIDNVMMEKKIQVPGENKFTDKIQI